MAIIRVDNRLLAQLLSVIRAVPLTFALLVDNIGRVVLTVLGAQPQKALRRQEEHGPSLLAIDFLCQPQLLYAKLLPL